MRSSSKLLALAACLAIAGTPGRTKAQSAQESEPRESQAATPDQPPAAYALPAGTRILIALQDPLSTKDDKAGKQFIARTLEPVVAPNGRVLPAGAEIHGHIDKIQDAHQTGRARLWLTFDNITTRRGRAPLVAELIDAPGVHSIRVVYDHEGEIETATSKAQQEAQAAAAAAIAGAATGIATKNARDAAIGAAIGAATAFMVTSGLGQDIFLEKETKLEIVLGRPLDLSRT